jgi:hypothetical protein
MHPATEYLSRISSKVRDESLNIRFTTAVRYLDRELDAIWGEQLKNKKQNFLQISN